MGAIARGVGNLLRSKPRTLVCVTLFGLVLSLFVLLAQAALAAREQVATLEARVRTLIELREAGAFGTGGFGGDKPVGEEAFTLQTLEKVRRIRSAKHLARVDEYVYKPLIDPSRKNAYAMIIGLRPGAALRAIGEVDYENAKIIAGRAPRPDDEHAFVAVVGRLFAEQRLGIDNPQATLLEERKLVLDGQDFRLVGIYSTGNDFGDNHVFIPIEAFRATFNPGDKLSKIFVTLDSVAHVEQAVQELKQIEEADVVTTPEAVSTARTTLAGLSLATALGAVLLFGVAATLVVFVMVLAVRERYAEIGTLKALGASNLEVVVQFIAESATLCALGGLGALALVVPLSWATSYALAMPLTPGAWTAASIVVAATLFAGLGCVYPVARALQLSPVEALRKA
ncbi:MAG: ABC transporter permease [Betaproteobacteria bacterium]|nr:ABC transporter permease [Betaproteobacteria bacterium]